MDYEIFKLYKEKLNLKAVDVQTTSPLILAYIGDCLYDLAVREYMVSNFPGVVNAVNQKKTTFVCAHAQSEIMGYLIGQGVLTDEEMSVYRRGRNQKSATHSKNSSIQEYRRATGFEALIDREARGITHLQALEDRYGEIRHEPAAEAEKE